MKKLLYLLGLSLYCVSAQAQNTLAGNLTVQQTIKLTGGLTPPTITSSVNDYNPTNLSTAAVLRLQSDVPRSITGLAGGVAGRMLWLTNVGTQTITLANESVSSAAANRFALGSANFDLLAGASISIWYDTTSSRWRSATSLAVGGGGGTTDQVARDAAAAAQATADAAETPTGAQSKADAAQAFAIQRVNHTGTQAATTITQDSTHRFATDAEKSAWSAKQDALINATTLAKITESANLPLWNGATWPGSGGGSGTVTTVSVVSANGVSGSVANATTTPAITVSLGAITPSSVAASGTVTGSNLSGTNTGDQTSVTGNAGTATALQTARTINGVSFNGTANITVPAAAGTLTGSTLASGVTASSLTSAAGGTFGTAAFTAASAYDPAGAAAAITLSGLGGVPTSRTVNGHALTGNVSVTASDVGLGSVENTAISTWAGSSNLSTLGTITSGTWHGSAIADTYIASAAAWNAKVSFPGFGITGTTAALGNDSRLSDARTPLAHNQAWSTITSTPTTLSGYGIADAQPLDSDLTSIAALTTTSFGRSLLTPADAAAARTILGVSSGGVSSVAGRTGDVTLAQADISGLTTTSTPQFAKLGIGMAAPSDSIVSIQHSSSGAGGKSAVIVTGSLNAPASTDLHPDAYRDSTTYTSAVAGDGYASYDAKATVTGSQPYNHMVGFQSRSIYSGSGLMDLYTGISHQATHNGSGTITTAIGAYMQDPLGSGPITSNFGVYVGPLTRGTNNWAFYNAGSAPSYLGGPLTVDPGLADGGLPAALSNTALRVAMLNSTSPAIEGIAFGSTALGFRCRLIGGTRTSPLATPGGSVFFNMAAFGHDGTSYRTGNNGTYAMVADGTWSGASRGVLHQWTGTASGATSAAAWMVLQNGALRLPTYGAGTLVTDSSGNVTASSDRRLKNVSGKFTRGLDAIMEIQPKVFTWKPESGMNPDDVNVGFIAQDVQGAIPEAVGTIKTSDTEGVDPQDATKKIRKSKREDAEFMTLSDRPILAALVNAVKELKAKNDELEARIVALETKK